MKFIVRNFPKFSKFLDQTKASIRSLNFSRNFLRKNDHQSLSLSIGVKIDLDKKKRGGEDGPIYRFEAFLFT